MRTAPAFLRLESHFASPDAYITHPLNSCLLPSPQYAEQWSPHARGRPSVPSWRVSGRRGCQPARQVADYPHRPGQPPLASAREFYCYRSRAAAWCMQKPIGRRLFGSSIVLCVDLIPARTLLRTADAAVPRAAGPPAGCSHSGCRQGGVWEAASGGGAKSGCRLGGLGLCTGWCTAVSVRSVLHGWPCTATTQRLLPEVFMSMLTLPYCQSRCSKLDCWCRWVAP